MVFEFALSRKIGPLIRTAGTAKRFCPPAQGCRFGYPGYTFEYPISTQRGCANSQCALHPTNVDTTPLGLEMFAFIVPRVAEAATLGWRTQPRWGWTAGRKFVLRCALAN